MGRSSLILLLALTGCRSPFLLAPRAVAQAAHAVVEPAGDGDASAVEGPGQAVGEIDFESDDSSSESSGGSEGAKPRRSADQAQDHDEEAAVAVAPGLELRFSGQGAIWLQGLDVDWTSVDRMNLGCPSVVPLNRRWGMAISSGQDRLEECQPTLALVDHRPGFSDTFVFLTATYRLTQWAHLIGSVAGLRIQDQALSEAVDDAQFSSATLGVYFHF